MTDKGRNVILDLYSGSGGAATGYARAGWNVIGVDKDLKSHYPFTFVQGDVLALFDWLVVKYRPDAIHTSPPCQRYSIMSACVPGTRQIYPDLIGPTREKLKASGLPYVIENVVGAPLQNPVMLCGTSFGKRVWRHRLFEASFPVTPLACRHNGYAMNPHKAIGRKRMREEFGADTPIEGRWAEEMEVAWMPAKEAREAVPPFFTEYLGNQLLVSMEHGTNRQHAA